MRKISYIVRDYKKAHFFILINLILFFSLNSQSLENKGELEFCRDSFELRGLNLSEKNHLEAVTSCITFFENKYPKIQDALEANLYNIYSSIDKSNLYIFNLYVKDCRFSATQQKKSYCEKFTKFFYEITLKGDDAFIGELYFDESILEKYSKNSWKDAFSSIQELFLDGESQTIYEKLIDAESCEYFEDYVDYDFKLIKERFFQARFLFEMNRCAYEMDSPEIYQINQKSIEFLDSENIWMTYYESSLAVDTAYILTNYGPNSSYSQLDNILKKRFNLSDTQYDLIYRWTENLVVTKSDEDEQLIWGENLTKDQAILLFLNLGDNFRNNNFYQISDLEKDSKSVIDYFEPILDDREKLLLFSSTGLVGLSILWLNDSRSCEISESYYLKAIEILEEKKVTDKQVIESLAENLILLSNCYMQTKDLADNSYWEVKKEFQKKDLEKAIFFANKAEEIFKSNKYRKGIISETFLSFQTELYNFHTNEDKSNHLKRLNNIFEKFVENERKIRNFDWLDPLQELINAYSFHVNDLKGKGFEVSTLIRPSSLKQIVEKIKNRRSIKYSKVLNKEYNASIKEEFLGNSKEIKKVEDELDRNFDVAQLEKLDNLYLKRQSILKNLYSKDEKLNNFYNSNLDELEKIKNKLNSKEAILTFQSSYSGISIFLTTKNDSVIFESYLLNKYSIDTIARMFRKSLPLGFKDKTFRYDLAFLIYETLFEQVDNYLGGDYTIYIYGEEFEQIPFHILISEEIDNYHYDEEADYKKLTSAKWLIDRYNFLRIYPLKEKKSESFKNKFLGVANSKFPNSKLTNLPSVKEEVKFLALASQSNKNLYFDKDATKQNFLRVVENDFERIVLATHSVEAFWEGKTFEPGLVLYESKEDFILTASEISLLDIETDMVVLSSCNSALKDFNSLYKAFLVAGSNSVLYTHWELDTKSAPEITESFFTKLWFESKLPKHESLRAAILEMKSNYSDDNFAHPAFWGNFALAYGSLDR